MISISLNQTESEKRLHRILYYVKVLRVGTLNSVLIFLAVALYLAFGITHLHPLAEDPINGLRSHADDPERYVYVLATLVTFLLGFAFLIWLNMSITRVWRKSLKAQSLFLVILSPVLYFVAIWLLFSAKHLDPLFTILFGLFWAFTLWYSADIVVGLWRISTSPETYSFTAIQDPRLTKGVWARFNKLLDLPCTPLRTWRTGSAYLLLLGSSVLLVTCLGYFTTFGSITGKLNQLYSKCRPETVATPVSIGARLRLIDGCAKIDNLFPGGPAQLDGRLKVGDRITAVAQGSGDYVDVREMPLDKFIEMIRGKRGTRVRLLVIPADETDPSRRKDIELVLDEIKLKDSQAPVKNMELCVKQSSAWAKQIGLWVILTFIGIRLSVLGQSTARKLSSLSVREALADSKQKYVLYLRSFTADQTILPKPRLPVLSKVLSLRPFPVRIEEELFDVTDGYLPLIAVGRPGESQELTGGLAYRDYLKDENWQTYVREKILAADSIVILLNSTGGLLWELENVLRHSAFAKTLFLIDPRAKDNVVWQNLTKLIIPMFAKAGVLAPDFQFAGHPIGFYFSRDQVVEIENTNWSATSYRTAFSHYLSERSRS